MAKMKLSDAPGCIGSPLIRNEKHPLCTKCNFTNVCGKLSKVNAQRLAESFGVARLSGDTGRKLLKGAEKMSVAQLEKAGEAGVRPETTRGAALRKQIFRKSSVKNLCDLLTNERRYNFIEHGLQFVEPEWARNVLSLIWQNGGAIKGRDMRTYLEHELGFKRSAAMSMASNFINATTNAGLIVHRLKEDELRINNASS